MATSIGIRAMLFRVTGGIDVDGPLGEVPNGEKEEGRLLSAVVMCIARNASEAAPQTDKLFRPSRSGKGMAAKECHFHCIHSFAFIPLPLPRY